MSMHYGFIKMQNKVLTTDIEVSTKRHENTDNNEERCEFINLTRI